MKKRRPAAPPLELDETRTGHHCPKTGWWSAGGDLSDTRFITKGEVMPALSGTPALWILSATTGNQGFRTASALLPSA